MFRHKKIFQFLFNLFIVLSMLKFCSAQLEESHLTTHGCKYSKKLIVQDTNQHYLMKLNSASKYKVCIQCDKLIIEGGRKAVTKIFSDFKEMKEMINDLKSSIQECQKGSITSPEDLEFFDIRYDVLPKKCVTEILPKNCVEATRCTQRSGIYKILVTQHSNEPFYVECDAETEGGGWIVIQSRKDGSEDFFRNWNDYEEGFGDVESEHFIGLKKLYTLTNFQGPQELLIVMDDVNNTRAFAKYDGFSVSDETQMYKLKKLGNFSGTAGDSLAYQLGMKFSTKDRDNSIDSSNCAEKYTGAWWYKSCHHSNLNGKYGDNTYAKGISWVTFRGHHSSLKYVKMMIRRRRINLISKQQQI